MAHCTINLRENLLALIECTKVSLEFSNVLLSKGLIPNSEYEKLNCYVVSIQFI